MMFPTDSNYVARCVNATFGEAKSSGNDQVAFDWEVVEPQEVEINGEMVNIAGIKCKTYATVTNYVDGIVDDSKTTASRERLKKLFEDAGLTFEGADFENLDVSGFKGLLFYVKMDSTRQEQRKTASVAELEEAKKKGIHPSQAGAVMKNPATGKDLISYFPAIREVFGLCASTGATKF